jgi:uncharacterized membrane protein
MAIVGNTRRARLAGRGGSLARSGPLEGIGLLTCRCAVPAGVRREASMKIAVVAFLIAIVTALFSALVFLYRDRGHGTRMVKALTIRVGLSIGLIAFLLLSYWMGWIGPQGLR